MLAGAVFDTLPQRRVLAKVAGTRESSPPWATLNFEWGEGAFTREPRAARDDSLDGEDRIKTCFSRRLTGAAQRSKRARAILPAFETLSCAF